MQCPHCHAQNADDAHFCEECGARIETVCPECGEANRPTAKFCRKCGHQLTLADAGGRSAASKFSSPDTYTPKHLAQKILAAKEALEGERKQCTVLFADLKGSTELVAERDPEEADRLLDPVIKLMMEAVHRYEGTVTRVMGDGIMALFGAPLAHEDHALRSCYAALAMHESMRRQIDKLRREHGFTLQIRVGINSGEVVVRNIGDDLYMEYTAMGQTTHLAARMEQLATPGGTFLTADTLKLVEGLVRVTSLGPIPVKGIPVPVEVYELLGASPLRTRLQAAQRRGLTPFVGRQTEVASLIRALEKAGRGQGQVVGVVGEPGVGKTRLFHEFARTPSLKGWLLLETDTASWGKATAYLPVIGLLKDYCHLEEGDDARTIREKVSGKLVTLDEKLMPSLPALLSLLDVPVDDTEWQKIDPTQRRERTLDAIKFLLMRESRVQPVCLVVENLHWIDSETQTLLDRLVESLPTAHLIMLVNYRPEYMHGWGGKTYFSQLRLDPLSFESAEDLLTSLLGRDDNLRPLKQMLIDRTEGNPFFLEEIVRTLLETEVLIGEQGAYRLAKSLPSIQVPATVQAVLAARLDRLTAEDKRLLESAAVVGKDVPYALLASVVELPEEALRAGLTNLQAGEFLYEASLFPEIEFTFKHSLTHEVAYATLLNEHRRALHVRIMDAIEQLYSDRLAEQVDRLAHHSFRGEKWDRAVGYLRQAGAKAAVRSAYFDAAENLERALIALRHLPESQETLEQGIDIRLDLRSSLQALGEHERVFEHCHEAETLASALKDQKRLGWASAYLSQYLWRMGDQRRAEELGQRAVAISSQVGDFALEVVATFFLGQGYFNIGDYTRAIDHCRRNVTVIKGERAYQRLGLTGLPSVLSRTWLAWSLAERGEFPEAMVHAKDSLVIAEAAGQPYSIVAACLDAGQVRLLQGALDEAIPMLERAAELCKSWDLQAIEPTTSAILGLAYALCGRIDEALSLIDRSEALATSTSMLDAPTVTTVRIFDTPAATTALGTVYLRAGRVGEAAKSTSRAAELAAKRGLRGNQARALQLLGEISAARNPPEVTQADDCYRRALAIAEELGMRPLVAHCRLGLGVLNDSTGKRAQAQEHLAIAIEMYQEMGMAFYLAQAETALAKLGKKVKVRSISSPG